MLLRSKYTFIQQWQRRKARLISQRTSLALKKAKERGVKLGVNGKVLAKANKKSANQFARKLRNEIHALSQCGFGYSDIARENSTISRDHNIHG